MNKLSKIDHDIYIPFLMKIMIYLWISLRTLNIKEIV